MGAQKGAVAAGAGGGGGDAGGGEGYGGGGDGGFASGAEGSTAVPTLQEVRDCVPRLLLELHGEVVRKRREGACVSVACE